MALIDALSRFVEARALAQPVVADATSTIRHQPASQGNPVAGGQRDRINRDGVWDAERKDGVVEHEDALAGLAKSLERSLGVEAGSKAHLQPAAEDKSVWLTENRVEAAPRCEPAEPDLPERA